MSKKKLLNIPITVQNYDYQSIEPEIKTEVHKKPEMKLTELKRLKDTKSGKKLF